MIFLNQHLIFITTVNLILKKLKGRQTLGEKECGILCVERRIIMHNKGKKYFIKDDALENTNSDFFGHMDFAQNIINIINTQEPSYNIAVLGKWGLGKSSLVNFVENFFNKDKKYKFITINAWKYEKEAFRKVFLKKTWERLGGTEKNWETTLSDALNNTQVMETEKHQKKWFLRVSSFVVKVIGYFIFITILVLVWQLISHGLTQGFRRPTLGSADGNPYVFSIFDATVGLFYVNPFSASIAPFILALAKDFLSSYDKKTAKSYNLSGPAKTTDDYENLLLEQLNKSSNENKIVVTIIEDLDRLPAGKIIDALDAIKSFTDISQCVFIVPFDEEKIIKAIVEAGRCKEKLDCYELGELLLDKLFQFRIHLPEIVRRDFMPYAKELCKVECPDLMKLCDEVQSNCFCDEILPILIHYNVETPRQIKKIINAFANKIVVIHFRKQQNKMNISWDILLLREIAKLSVLQADFLEFYNELYSQPSLLKDIYVWIEEGKVYKDYKGYYKGLVDGAICSANMISQESWITIDYLNSLPSFSNLLIFLNNYRHIKMDANKVRVLVYVSDSKAAMRTGGMEQKISYALSTGDWEAAIPVLKHISNPCEYLVSELLEGQLSRNVEKHYLVAVYGLYTSLDEKERKQLSNVISKKTRIALSTYSFFERKSIEIPDVLCVYFEAQDKKGVENLLIIQIKELEEKSCTLSWNASINSILRRHNDLSHDICTSYFAVEN